MAGHEHGDDRSTAKGHETRDVNTAALGKWLLVLAAVLIGTYGLTVGLFRHFSAREVTRSVAEGGPAAAQPAGGPTDEQLKWPEPRIQSDPADDMARLRAEQTAVLQSYGWVDRDAGIVRVPIALAMKLVLDEGLPAREPGFASPASGAPVSGPPSEAADPGR